VVKRHARSLSNLSYNLRKNAKVLVDKDHGTSFPWLRV
jgi:hypothetical protein